MAGQPPVAPDTTTMKMCLQGFCRGAWRAPYQSGHGKIAIASVKAGHRAVFGWVLHQRPWGMTNSGEPGEIRARRERRSAKTKRESGNPRDGFFRARFSLLVFALFRFRKVRFSALACAAYPRTIRMVWVAASSVRKMAAAPRTGFPSTSTEWTPLETRLGLRTLMS